MARAKKKSDKKPIEQYDHKGKEGLNNPPVGLVTPETDKKTRKKTYTYDPHLDPSLQWAGKAEHTSFEVPTVSLHVHERIDPEVRLKKVTSVIASKTKQSDNSVSRDNSVNKQRANITSNISSDLCCNSVIFSVKSLFGNILNLFLKN